MLTAVSSQDVSILRIRILQILQKYKENTSVQHIRQEEEGCVLTYELEECEGKLLEAVYAYACCILMSAATVFFSHCANINVAVAPKRTMHFSVIAIIYDRHLYLALRTIQVGEFVRDNRAIDPRTINCVYLMPFKKYLLFKS